MTAHAKCRPPYPSQYQIIWRHIKPGVMPKGWCYGRTGRSKTLVAVAREDYEKEDFIVVVQRLRDGKIVFANAAARRAGLVASRAGVASRAAK